mmetsp:Transcript_2422/g.5264  ORF Transcript_2422/g.5264 Transcript_2422/m.5264 type:complete len:230 (+) Transcript_2422:2677-3366(+)
MIGTAIDGGDSNFLTGFESKRANGSKRRGSLGVTILFPVQNCTNRGSFETAGDFQAGGFSKYLILVKHNGQQRCGFVRRFNERKAIIPFLFDGDLGTITGFRRHFVKRHIQSIIGVVHTKPTFKSAPHTLEHAFERSPTSFHCGQTIQDLQFNRGSSGIGKRSATNQRRKVFFWKNIVLDGGGQSVATIDFLDFDFVCADVQDALWLVWIVIGIIEVSGHTSAKGLRFE